MQTRRSREPSASAPSDPSLPSPTPIESKKKVLQPTVKQERGLVELPSLPIDKPSSSPQVVAQPAYGDALSLLSTKVDQLQAIVEQLSADKITLSATVAHLSSAQDATNEELRWLREDQDTVVEMVSKGMMSCSLEWRASRDGEGGVWGRFVPEPRPIPTSPVLDPLSLPTLLVHRLRFYCDDEPATRTLVSFLGTSDLLALCLVSKEMLMWAGHQIYRSEELHCNSREAALFVDARTTYDEASHSHEITHILTPYRLVLLSANFHRSDLRILQPSPNALFLIHNLDIGTFDRGGDFLASWSPLLSRVNPVTLTLGSNPEHRLDPPPRTLPIQSSDLAFADEWNRLRDVRIVHPARIVVVVGEEGRQEFAFRPVMERSAGGTREQTLRFETDSVVPSAIPGGKNIRLDLEVMEDEFETWFDGGTVYRLQAASHTPLTFRREDVVRRVLPGEEVGGA